MTDNISNLTGRLKAECERLGDRTLREMFKADEGRFEKFSAHGAGLFLDYSKNRIDEGVMQVLFDIARNAGVEEKRAAMFRGEKINVTEDRAVLHTALRAPPDSEITVDGVNVVPEVQTVLGAMAEFCDAVRSGEYAVTGGKITDVVNIGIGGSDLGPAMANIALKPFIDGPDCHFVSNIDGADISEVLKEVPLETTLFIIASKTFTTAETMTNAKTALAAVEAAVGKDAAGKDAAGRHFAALSTNLEATRAFGIEDERTFGFWDWVGGRYSIWSAIGLSLMMAIGPDQFMEFLEGGREMDEHFQSASLEENLPVILAMIGVWYRNGFDMASHAILPYDQRLARFAAYLQQLEMESNGKSVSLHSTPIDHSTCPVIWGEPGTNGQHAFYQLIHQGTEVIPVDFLLAKTPQHEFPHHHTMLVANCLAQAEALMSGKTLEEASQELRDKGMDDAHIAMLAPHKVFPGNRPSNMLVYETLDPRTLGQLIALYEHKVFVQGVVWNINSYDQWGVELGKVLATDIEAIFAGEATANDKDASTKGLIAKLME